MKTLKYLFIAALAIFSFNACEDVPAPYDIPAMSGSSGAGGGSSEDVIFEQNFSNSLGNFTQFNNNPEVEWVNDFSSAVAKGYVNGKNLAAVSYLVSPAFDLTGKDAAHIALKYVICYANNATVKANHQLLITDNYTGDATTTNWTVLDYGAVGSSSFTFGDATVNIPEQFLGKNNIYTAFKYTSTTEKASTWEIKSITIKDGEASADVEEETGEVMTVAQALAAFTGTAKPAIVKGYIVGFIPDKSIDEATFNGNATAKTNIIIADTPDETDITKCMPIQLPSGEIRNKVNLQENPGNYKKVVTLTGSLEKYFGVTGLKSVSKALFEGEEDDSDDENKGNVYLDEKFADGLGSFTTAQIVNDYAWKHEVYNDKAYAKVSGYANGASQDAESWLISPAIDFTGETTASISFDYVINKGNASLAAVNHKLMITDNYTGDFYTTNWDEIEFGATNDNTWNFRSTGNIAIPESYMGKEAVVIAFKYVSTTSASSTWEVNNVLVTGEKGGSVEGDDNTGDDNTGDDNTDEEKGNGTLESPYTPAGANAFASTLASGSNSDKEVYIKGIICSIKEAPSSQYGNATFYISADGSTGSEQFYVYRCYNLGNQKFTGNEQLNVGDEVIICGKVTNYMGDTPETVQNAAYIYSLNGETGDDNTGDDNTGDDNTEGEKGDGTLESPYTPAGANAFASTLASGSNSDKEVYIKGIICNVKYQPDAQYGNATFYISADGSTGSEQFYVYRCYNLGNKKFTGSEKLNVGDEVIICGKVTNYMGNTPETVQNAAYIYSLNGNTGGDNTGDDNTGDDNTGDDNTGDDNTGGDDTGDDTGDDNTNLPEGSMSVAQAISAYNGGTTGEVTITAYIVGYAKSAGSGFVGEFSTGTVLSNIIIADNPDETDSAKCMPVQLKSGTDIRTALNISENPGNLGKKVTLTGSLEKYFSSPGLKELTAYSFE